LSASTATAWCGADRGRGDPQPTHQRQEGPRVVPLADEDAPERMF
jgi:hypothetical protein